MLFNSYEFLLLFLPATLLGYYALRRWGSVHAGLVFLVSASLFFYGWWEPGYLVLILGSSVFNFLCGRSIGARDKAGQSTAMLLAFGVTVNLGLLGYFKYANFLIDTVNDLSGGGFGTLNIVLPLAISFFTFQQVAFLVDAAQGKAEEPNFLGYLLFVTFFPQLIAGPIVHHRETIPQFFHSAQAHQIWRNLAVGFTIATTGLFKKTVLAERAGYWGDQSFSLVAQGTDISFIEAWTGTLGFSFEIYFDFSGYSDMAIGLARMFGIILPLNFASPYKATSIIEFWRCWHMTLSRFLRDYLYIPLGGNRLGPIRRYANLFVVMLLGGLWHGANWTFVVWGGLHGVYLAINYAWRGWRGDPNGPSLAGRWGGRVLTFLAVSVAWVFFRAESFSDAMVMLRGLIGLNGVVLPAHYADVLGGLAPWLGDLGLVFGAVPAYSGGWQIVSLAALLGFVWFFPSTQEILRDYEPSLDNKGIAEQPVGFAWVVWRPTLAMGIVWASLPAISHYPCFRGIPVSSSISSFRRFTLAFVTVFCVAAVVFVAGTEALIRVYVAPRDAFDTRKQAFLNGREPAAVFGDSRVVSGIDAGDGLANFADTGANLDTILGKLAAYAQQGRGRQIVLQLAPQHFALYRLNDNQKDRLQEFLDPDTAMLQLLRPHYRRYLFDYWRAVIRNPRLLQAQKPKQKSIEINLTDMPLKAQRQQALIRTQLHIPVSGYAATDAMRRLRATVLRAHDAGIKFCFVGFPVAKAYRIAAGDFRVFAEIRTFYKAFADQIGAPYLDLWDAYDDRYFTNVDHLNDSGAQRLTREIQRRCLT